MRVVIAEDLFLLREGLIRLLEAYGFEVAAATDNGEDFLAAIRKGGCDVAVSELLANVSKHAQARETWIDIRHTDRMLRIGVTDNGHGGADPARGTGLRGIERRLAAFDGVMAISSPPGGPTAVTMEIPCELSLPKTSSS